MYVELPKVSAFKGVIRLNTNDLSIVEMLEAKLETGCGVYDDIGGTIWGVFRLGGVYRAFKDRFVFDLRSEDTRIQWVAKPRNMALFRVMCNGTTKIETEYLVPPSDAWTDGKEWDNFYHIYMLDSGEWSLEDCHNYYS